MNLSKKEGVDIMPRQSRRISESKIYHVMIRGNERKEIFNDDEDKSKFIEILSAKNDDNQYSIYAYCLMDNHVHLLLNEGDGEVSRIMQRINISYAYYFNKKYDRIGHLFQDRFKSGAIEDDNYLLATVRYIHNNPVKAKLVSNPSEYKWSSYNDYISKNIDNQSDSGKAFILGMFSTSTDNAVKMFIEFSSQDSTELFIEYKEVSRRDKTIQSEEEAREFVANYLQERNTNLIDIKEACGLTIRNTLISQLKKQSYLSIREIADLLQIGRNIVQRVR